MGICADFDFILLQVFQCFSNMSSLPVNLPAAFALIVLITIFENKLRHQITDILALRPDAVFDCR